ncbi:Enoyl-CoA hydratase/carnithine racemase [Erythrobacter litoralis]|jgi:enoyl-CoA hydratase/carnithine racemase|uniref:Enoyl-CoA hydratase n=1 Tax=Erythrobacter litoralis TaxID=39960 RepID=A0A074MER7_9SPHN|nr:crotonase/enoyl-CoA hydratase family protein [Erythrobacter litoralis]AOL24397.1 Enoyl-CoA hydratase/carnithine racemase [Erythrobacter litoralis]KEO93361.1 enoyl-CoA hydratase [Erythrobacter litoralis]MEE4338623.1 crotonase/enoyl-CoA hydratase family protein [Erythrobacter sp.]
MTNPTQITVEKADGIATITLDRPEKMNAYTGTMGAEIIAAMDDIDADDKVRAVIFTGSGEKAFCAGADLTPEGGGQVFSSGEEVKDLSDSRVRDGGGLLTLRLFESKKPLISACNGVAVGVGATMQLAMDIRLASETARYGFVFARRGIVPEAASSWFLPRIVGISQALEWCYSGRVFDAAEAKAGGLVRSVHAPADLMFAAKDLASEIAENTSAISVAMTRAMMWRLMSADHPMEAHKIDSRAIYRLSRGADAKEGIASFLDKRRPVYPGRVSEDMPDFYPWWEERTYE